MFGIQFIRMNPIYWIVAVVVIAGCGTITINSTQYSDAKIKKRYANQSVTKVMETLTLRLSKARGEQFELYSPRLFDKAQQAFTQAQSLYRGKAPPRSVLHQAYAADVGLDNAYKTKQLATQQLGSVFRALESLKALRITASYISPYNMVVAKARYLVEDLEDRVTSGGAVDIKAQQRFEKDKNEVLSTIQQLKVEMVRYNVLEKPMASLEDFIEDAKRFAPKSYQEIQKAQEAVDKVIQTDVDNTELLRQASKKFQFAVAHAMQVTKAVMQLRSMDRNQYEDYVMDLELKLIPISNALENGELRDHSFYEQTIELSRAASKIMHEYGKLKQKHEEMLAASDNGQTPVAKPAKVVADDSQQNSDDMVRAQEEIKSLNEQISKLQFVVKGLQRSERPLKDKIWLLEQQVAELGTENKRLNRKNQELQNKLSRR